MIKAFFTCAAVGALGTVGVVNEPKLNMPKNVEILDNCTTTLPNSGVVAEFTLENREYYVAPDQRVFVLGVSGAGMQTETETLVGQDVQITDSVQSLCDAARKQGLKL